MQPPRRRIRRTQPGNALDEGRAQAGLEGLPEDLLREQGPRPPILSPRGVMTGMAYDDPGAVPLSPPPPPRAVRNFNPQSVTTYRVDLAAGVPTPVFAATRERSYSIIINGGGNDCVIAYGRAPADATDGIPLASGGVGFHELINGTTGTVTAYAAAATFLIVTEGRFDPPMNS